MKYISLWEYYSTDYLTLHDVAEKVGLTKEEFAEKYPDEEFKAVKTNFGYLISPESVVEFLEREGQAK